MPRLNKSTGLFGRGGGRRKGAKSKVRQWLDDKKKSKTNKKAVKSRQDSTKDIYKHSKKDSIKLYKDQGMSRKEAKEQTMKDAKATRQKQGQEHRSKVASDKLAKQKAWEADQAAKRAATKKTGPSVGDGSGLASAEESAKKAAEMKQSREASKRDDLERDRRAKNRTAEEAAKGGFYEKIGRDGKTKTVITRSKQESNEEWEARKAKARSEYKPKAKYGAKVKTVKKADNGASTDPVKGKKMTSKNLSDREIKIAKNKKFKAYAIKKGILPDFDKIKNDKERSEKMEKFYGNKKNVSMLNEEQSKYFKEKGEAKHGASLAIMISPVKTKNKKTVKAIKKGAKAQNGGRVLTESQKRAAAGVNTKSDPKKQAAQPRVSKPPGMGKVSSLKNGGRLLKKSKRLQEKDAKLKAKVTEVYKEGGYENNKKAERIQKKRMRVQKRENKAFHKGYTKKLASERK